jgi:hypothetical protein
VGLSLAELAEGIMGSRAPAARGYVKGLLDDASALLGGLWVGRGDDGLGHADVRLYGVRQAQRSSVAGAIAALRQ